MRVLSLFDGISIGLLALKQAGIPVSEYHACEIDKHAIKISQKNFPEIVQLGDVTKLDIQEGQYDLLLAGFPCQAWSSAGKQLGLADPRGQLALTMFDIFKKLNPKYFMFENVASMSKGNKAFLDKLVGVEGVTIDSGLVSAQNRRRIYWSNFQINQPEDRGIMLQDILEDGFVDRDKSYCIDANYFKGGNLKSYFEKRRRQLVFRDAIAWSSSGRGNGKIEDRFRVNDKANTLMASGTGCGGAKTLNIVYSNEGIRILTPIECERLMGLPDGFTEGISNTQRYKCLGNGWECNTVTSIFKDLKDHIDGKN